MLSAAKSAKFVQTFILSDIISNPVNLIASGPTIPSIPVSISPLLEKFNTDSFGNEVIQDALRCEAENLDYPKNEFLIIGENRLMLESVKAEADKKGLREVVQSFRIFA